MARLTLGKIIKYIKLLRIDVFMLLWATSFSLPTIPGTKLIQDKYCISDLKRDPQLCLDLEKLGPEYEELKDDVIKFSASYSTYVNYITVIPQIFYALFLGYWLDKHPKHLPYLMAIPSIAGILSSSITLYNIFNFETKTLNLLWSVIPNMFFGGMSTMIIGAYVYLARRVPPEYRSGRLGLLAFFVLVPMVGARIWGASLLYQKPMFGLYRNYVGVQVFTMLAALASALWAVIMLYDAGDPPIGDDLSLLGEPKEKSNSNMGNNENMTTRAKGEEDRRPELKDKTLETSQTGSNHSEPSDSFLQNLTEMFTGIWTIFTKNRPNNKRIVLACLMISAVLMNIDSVGESSVDLQFVQKVYHWDAVEYADASGLVQGMGGVAGVVLPILLVNVLHIDEILIIVGCCVSLLLGVIVKGGILEPWAYYLGGIIMLPSGTSRIVLQAVISRVVDINEFARMSSLLGLTDALGPTIASTLYTLVFNATIAFAPWFYHFVTFFMLMIPLIGLLWLDYTKRSWDPIVVRRESRAASLKPNDVGLRFKAGRRISSNGKLTPVSMSIDGDAV